MVATAEVAFMICAGSRHFDAVRILIYSTRVHTDLLYTVLLSCLVQVFAVQHEQFSHNVWNRSS